MIRFASIVCLPLNPAPASGCLLFSFSDGDNIGLERDSQISLAGTHDQRMFVIESLQVMNVPVVSAIRFVVGHDLSLFPGSLKIVFLNEATQASCPSIGLDSTRYCEWASNSQYIAEAVERDLVLDGVYKFAGDLVAGEGPANFARTDVGDHLLISVDKIWLLVSEVKGALESAPLCSFP